MAAPTIRRLVRRTLIGVAMIVLSLCMSHHTLRSQDQEKEAFDKPKANVFVYSQKLTATDKLVDGLSATNIPIKGETTLIWVDLAPDQHFTHPTQYVLIDVDGARTVPGHWWPVLNGNQLFRKTTPYTVEFPIKMVGM